MSPRHPSFRHQARGVAQGVVPPEERERTERFRAVFMPHLDAAYTVARYLTRHPIDAEDIVQEAYLRAFKGFDSWRGESAKAWLLMIVRNCFLASMPAQGRGAVGDVQDIAVDHRDPETILVEDGEATMLRTSIAGLPPPFRETLILREIEELSYKEIAKLTDAPIGTVMSRLARARQMLTEKLLRPGTGAGPAS